MSESTINTVNTSAHSQPQPGANAPVPPYIPQPPMSFQPKEPRPLNPVQLEAQQPRSLFMVIALLVFSVLFSEVVLRGTFSGVSMTASIFVFYGIAVCYLRGRKNSFSKSSMLMLIPIALLALSYIFDNGLLAWFVTSVFLAVLIPVQLTAMSGITNCSIFSAGIFSKAAAAAFPQLFGNFDAPFMAFGAVKNKSKTRKKLFMILLGIIISVPFLLIFLSLFASADPIFESYIDSIAEFFHFDLASCVFNLVAGLSVALLLSAFLLVLRGASLPEKEAARAKSRLNPFMTSAFLALIILIQVVFIAVQYVYLFGSHTMPEGTTYAEYARNGFFQISAASILTAVLILLISLFGERAANGTPVLQTKILLTVLTCCDFFLYYCAYVKMAAYIEVYNLSVRRIGVCWLMGVMALVLSGVLIHMWQPKFKLAGWVLACLCISVIALNICSPDRLTAKYNIDLYLSDTTSVRVDADHVGTLDTEYLGTLSPSVIPELDRLTGTPKEWAAKKAMEEIAPGLYRRTWKGWKITDGEAYEVLKKHGITHD